MIVNNSEQIGNLLSFNEGDFYFIQIIKRRRENPLMPKGSATLRSFCVNSMESYTRTVPHIIETCDHENARAYILLNKRNYKKLGLRIIKRAADIMHNGSEHTFPNIFESIVGEEHHDPNKKWLVDVDWNEFKVDMPELISDLTEFQGGKKWTPLIIEIPTKNGCHIITHPFNMEKFTKKYPKNMVHKEDATTLLYCP